jgi:DNA repair protein RecO (recombination protein O)
MDERCTGLILRTYPLTETSLIIHWLSSEAGRVATVAKGARRPKSPFRGKLDLYYLAQFSFARSRRSELHMLREVELLDAHSPLRQDLAALRRAAYAAALVGQTTETETPVPELYTLMLGFVRHLAAGTSSPQSVLAFELKLLQWLGMEPDWPQEKLSPGTRALLSSLVHLDWETVAKVRLSAGQGGEAAHFMHAFLHHHLERVPQSRVPALLAEGDHAG